MANLWTKSHLFNSFLGTSPVWYKKTILLFLVLNPLLALSGHLTGIQTGWILGWILLVEFMFTLIMALRCYPLQPGGLLAIEAIILGLTSSEAVYHEISSNLPVFLLLMYLVAGIFFMKELLLLTFSIILRRVRHRVLMNTSVLLTCAVLSAFLDALTVLAVLITVTGGFYRVYRCKEGRAPLRKYLCSMTMSGAIGTALGGVCTLVGEPQNLLIAALAQWGFIEFFIYMAPVTIPCLIAGVLTCILLSHYRIFGYGSELDDSTLNEILDNLKAERPLLPRARKQYRVRLQVQAISGLLLVIALMFSLAEVGLIGLALLVILTAFTGVVEEHRIGAAFSEALPFTALLACFFVIVAVIHDQHLFTPVNQWVYSFSLANQPAMLYLTTGLLSTISDNVFVAIIYMKEAKGYLDRGEITREHFNLLAVAINTGTNLPSIATPNGQAGFLFLLTSSLAPVIGLSYMRMVMMALPYTVMVVLVGFLSVIYLL